MRRNKKSGHRGAAAAGTNQQVAEARRALREALSDQRGYLFVASDKTFREVLEKRLFGLPQSKLALMRRTLAGAPLLANPLTLRERHGKTR